MTKICESLKIPDLNDNDFDITAGSIKEAVMEHQDIELKERIFKSTKMDKFKTQRFQQSPRRTNRKIK